MTQREPVGLPVIRQSIRSCRFGALGLIPGIGVVIAWHAMQLARGVERKSAERWRVDFPMALFAVALVANPFLQLGLTWVGAVANIFFLSAIVCAWVWASLNDNNTPRWNPARWHAVAGLFLGGAGIAVTVLLLEACYVAAYSQHLFGIA